MYVRAVLTRPWLWAVHVKLRFDEGRIYRYSWLSVQSMATNMNTLNTTTLVQLHLGVYISVETGSISCHSYCRPSDFDCSLWILMSFFELIRNNVLKIWQLIMMSRLDCCIPTKVQALVKIALTQWHYYTCKVILWGTIGG